MKISVTFQSPGILSNKRTSLTSLHKASVRWALEFTEAKESQQLRLTTICLAERDLPRLSPKPWTPRAAKPLPTSLLRTLPLTSAAKRFQKVAGPTARDTQPLECDPGDPAHPTQAKTFTPESRGPVGSLFALISRGDHGRVGGPQLPHPVSTGWTRGMGLCLY